MTTSLPLFQTIRPGMLVIYEGVPHLIERRVNDEEFIATNQQTREPRIIKASGISFRSPGSDETATFATFPDVESMPSADFAKAMRRYEAIAPMLKRIHTRAEVAEIAKRQEVSTATIYNWKKTYSQHQHVSALIDGKPGPRNGYRALRADVEQHIDTVIHKFYLSQERHSIRDIYNEVAHICEKDGLTSPSYTSIRARILDINPELRLRKRGYNKKADALYTPTPGGFNAEYPMQYVQIDHTPGDIILVHPKSREPIGRPYVTTAIDVYSRAIVDH